MNNIVPKPDKPNILIVEDDQALLKMYSLWLAPIANVRLAKDGADAWVSAKAVKPDILMVDLLMPIMDGYQFLRQANQDSILTDVPVILISGAFVGVNSNYDFQILKKVVDVFLLKPIYKKDMIESVSKLIESMKENKNDGDG